MGAALDAREAVVRRQPTALGQFLAGVMRERVGADLALLNSGAIRGDRVLPPGPVTRRDIHELLPFANTIALIEVEGAALRSALERSVDALPRPAGHYLQTAALSYALDPDAPVGHRVSEIRAAGQPLDPGRRYRVALLDYLARGKDGYPMLAKGRMVLAPEDGPGFVQSVLEALAEGRSP